MAESESGQDKTEDPTEKKKKDAREKGEIARSRELNTLAIMLAGAGALLIFGGALAQDMMDLMRLNFPCRVRWCWTRARWAPTCCTRGRSACWRFNR